MSGVHGSSEAAEQLRRSILKIIQTLRSEVENQADNLKSLSTNCRDDSYTAMERCTKITIQEISQLLPSIAMLCCQLEQYRDYLEKLDEGQSVLSGGAVKVLRIPVEQRRAMGMRYIDRMMDVYRDNMTDKGIPEGKDLDSFITFLKSHYLAELEKDLVGKANGLYEDPNFDTITKLGIPFLLGMHNTLSTCSHQDVREIYIRYTNHVKVCATNFAGAKYKANDGVYFNKEQAANGDGIMDLPYQTAFHEFAHNIDYLMGNGSPISESWGNNALYHAIVADYDALRDGRSNEQLIADLKRETVEKGWTLAQIGSVSDILECMSGIDYPLGGGHGKVLQNIMETNGQIKQVMVSYWKNRLPNKEFFAETLDGAAANTESYQMLRLFFPRAVEVVHSILGGHK